MCVCVFVCVLSVSGWYFPHAQHSKTSLDFLQGEGGLFSLKVITDLLSHDWLGMRMASSSPSAASAADGEEAFCSDETQKHEREHPQDQASCS